MPRINTLKRRLSKTLSFIPAVVLSAGLAHAATITYTASLASATEVPPSGTTGVGSGTFTFDTTASTVTYSLSYSSLSTAASLAHLHFGPVGVSGPVIVPFSPSPSGTSGSISGIVAAAQINFAASPSVTNFTDLVNAAAAGNIYANLHTLNFPNGEIRGQLVSGSAVPEPSSIGLMAAAAMILACIGGRKALLRSTSR